MNLSDTLNIALDMIVDGKTHEFEQATQLFLSSYPSAQEEDKKTLLSALDITFRFYTDQNHSLEELHSKIFDIVSRISFHENLEENKLTQTVVFYRALDLSSSKNLLTSQAPIGLKGYYSLNNSFFKSNDVDARIISLVREVNKIDGESPLIGFLLDSTQASQEKKRIKFIADIASEIESNCLNNIKKKFDFKKIRPLNQLNSLFPTLLSPKNTENDILHFTSVRLSHLLEAEYDDTVNQKIRKDYLKIINNFFSYLPKNNDFGNVTLAINAIITEKTLPDFLMSSEISPASTPMQRTQILEVLKNNNLITLASQEVLGKPYDFLLPIREEVAKLKKSEPLLLYIGCGRGVVNPKEFRQEIKSLKFLDVPLPELVTGFISSSFGEINRSCGSVSLCDHGSECKGLTVNIGSAQRPDVIVDLIDDPKDQEKFIQYLLDENILNQHPLHLIDHSGAKLLEKESVQTLRYLATYIGNSSIDS